MPERAAGAGGDPYAVGREGFSGAVAEARPGSEKPEAGVVARLRRRKGRAVTPSDERAGTGSSGAGAPVEPVDEDLAVRPALVGTSSVVRRVLPTRRRTTVGAWCFLDHYGPDDVATGPGMDVGPHPHIGIQTVTWLFEGQAVHRDSLGHTQVIAPGQLNLMTAGAGIAHAEVSPVPRPRWLHGVQLWVALPGDQRHRAPAFEHHPALPVVEFDGGEAVVLVGELAGIPAPSTSYTPLVGAEVTLSGPGRSSIPLEPAFEYAVLGVDGPLQVAGRTLGAGEGHYLGLSRRALEVAGSGRFLLLGGEPLGEPLVMWWNFVGRTHEDVVEARADWEAGRRFPPVPGYEGPRVPAPELPPGRLVGRR